MLSKTKVYAKCGVKNLLIECACGCGNIKHLFDRTRIIHHYISGHNRKGSRKSNYTICIDSHGYKRIWNPKRQNSGYEHRFIYEMYYRCCLLPTVHIHHVDGNKTNNEISNLLPMSHRAHIKLEASKGIIGFQKGYKPSKPPWNKKC